MNKFLITITSILALTACTPNTINGKKVDNTPNIQKPQEINKPNFNCQRHQTPTRQNRNL
ncbi:hypothetical protein [Moraxella bovis]|uniref:hypothetical protein n=1 Tax=Moraxella bovis TaxID=476 RepID=UPI00222648CB|nr:hypothetical protein [Moraxella bovis]UZA37063.1 hypothetical protein LP101_07645 [Moraxella bovis]